jgi:hypothetical protein
METPTAFPIKDITDSLFGTDLPPLVGINLGFLPVIFLNTPEVL